VLAATPMISKVCNVNYMSKKNKAAEQSHNPVHEYAEEYRFIRHDLIKVIVINGIFLALVLAVYFTNSKSGYLVRWFSGVTGS
jgi:hypothetical protein